MRRVTPLAAAWIATLLIVAFVWWLFRESVWAGLITPLIPLMFAPAVLVTWRWFRHRSREDRRGHERRAAARRTEHERSGVEHS